jgi:hypothetical protein
MSTISINGRSFSVSGNNVSVINGKVIVDGKVIEEGLSGDVNIKWEGDLASLNCNNCEVSGNVGGDVKCNNAKIQGNVGGDVKGNDVKCGDVKGSVKGNSVKYRKPEDKPEDKGTIEYRL